MLSEEVNIKLGEYGYDFNSKDKIIIVKEKEKSENNIKNDETKKDNIENDIILVKNEELPTKKYQIKNLGNNVMNLPENYSTDDADEFKFINLINESNDNYELAVDSKTVKTFAKITNNIQLLKTEGKIPYSLSLIRKILMELFHLFQRKKGCFLLHRSCFM